jgi:hypothetical protein
MLWNFKSPKRDFKSQKIGFIPNPQISLDQMDDLIMLLEHKHHEVTLLQIQVDKLMTNDKNI